MTAERELAVARVDYPNIDPWWPEPDLWYPQPDQSYPDNNEWWPEPNQWWPEPTQWWPEPTQWYPTASVVVLVDDHTEMAGPVVEVNGTGHGLDALDEGEGWLGWLVVVVDDS